jgi:hypothetical protein
VRELFNALEREIQQLLTDGSVFDNAAAQLCCTLPVAVVREAQHLR